MSPEYSDVHIESSLPKPWEEETTFNDVLYDWMSRAPWMAISGLAHLLVYFILAAIPWDQFGPEKTKKIQAAVEAPPEEIFEEPEEEIVEEVEDPIDEPVLKDSEVSEDVVEDVSEVLSDSPFENENFNDVIGIGGGAGGKFGGRFKRKRQGGAGGGSGTEEALKNALEWLKNHQSPDGYWDADGYDANCGKIGSGICEGAGHESHDVGVTALALLAMMGDGNTTSRGPYKDVVSRGINWLKKQQDHQTGLIGEDTAKEFIYNHAIATLAICEAYYFGKNPLIKRTAQKAVDYILDAQNPYGAWRYDVPPIGENDSSITGWMIFALRSAQDAGLKVPAEALEWAMAFLDEMTDSTGNVGYMERFSSSSRTPANKHYPVDKGKALTAVGLLCRVFMGQDPEETMLEGVKIMERQAELLAENPPAWIHDPDAEIFGCDMYYWYYGTYAMYQMGGDSWKKWNLSMKEAVVENQRNEGDTKGSWDPVGPWGEAGGRVYSTALMTLCIEVYFRYAKVLGAR